MSAALPRMSDFLAGLKGGSKKGLLRVLKRVPKELFAESPEAVHALILLVRESPHRALAVEELGAPALLALVNMAGNDTQLADDLIWAARWVEYDIKRGRTRSSAQKLTDFEDFLEGVRTGRPEALARLQEGSQQTASTAQRVENLLGRLKPDTLPLARRIVEQANELGLQHLMEALAVDPRRATPALWRWLGEMDAEELQGMNTISKYGFGIEKWDGLRNYHPGSIRWYPTEGRRNLMRVLNRLEHSTEPRVIGLDEVINKGMRTANDVRAMNGQLRVAEYNIYERFAGQIDRVVMEEVIRNPQFTREIDVRVILKDGRVIDNEVKTLTKLDRTEWLVMSRTRLQAARDLSLHMADQFQNLNWFVMNGAPLNLGAVQQALRDALLTPEFARLVPGANIPQCQQWLDAAIAGGMVRSAY